MDTPSTRSHPPIGKVLLIGILVAALWGLLYLANPSLVRLINNPIMDAIVADHPKVVASKRVVVVTIDDDTLNHFGQWPWPRYQLARLLATIEQRGARSIALGFVMAEPDRTSLKALGEALEREYGYAVDTADMPPSVLDNDAVLAQTLARGPFVLGYEFQFAEDPGYTKNDCSLHPLQVLRIHKQSAVVATRQIHQADKVLCNLSSFAAAVSFSGFMNGRPDPDGILRRLPLVIAYKEQLYPSLALAAFMQAEGVSGGILRQTGIDRQILQLAGKSIPIDGYGHLRVDFRADPAFLPHVSALSILADEDDSQRFDDQIVFVGLTAPGLHADYATPVETLLPEIEIHAQLTEMLLSESFIRRTLDTVVVEILVAAAAALLISLCAVRLSLLPLWTFTLLGLVALWHGADLVYDRSGMLWSPLLPAVVMVFCGLFLSVYIYWIHQQVARRSVQDAVVLMRGSEKQLNSIIQTIPDIVFRLDTEGRITFISPAIAKYAENPEALIGKHILDIVAPADRKMAAYRINERRTGPRATSDVEMRLLLSPPGDGSPSDERYFSVSAQGIYAKETPDKKSFQGTQGIARDISRRKLLEHQLEQSKKMEAIGGLAAGVAHDLNNILSGLVSYPELLLLDLPKDSPMRKHIENIQRSGHRAAAIVQDMLTIARQGVRNSEITNLNDAIATYLASPEHQRLRHTHPQIAMKIDYAKDLMNVKASRVHVAKVLMNLVNNAAEAMPSGGTISVATRNRYLDESIDAYERIPEGEYVVISIADEGIGIAAEYLPRIFEPFFTKKRMGQSGSGLGMTVVWSSVKEHDGYIDIHTAEGEGARFDIYFPATRDILVDKERIVLEDYVGTERILVVDDVEEQRDIAVRMLGKLGYQVTALASGEKAVEYLQTHRVDLVVLDMVMHPGIDGLETYRRICQIHPQQKAIIASGFSESERVKALQAMGAGAYIRKPYTLEKIGLAIRRELDRSLRT
jgi:PAS domain S-box-containing protein